MYNTIQQNNIIRFFRLFFPLNKRELLVFASVLTFYLCIALYFVFFSSLIDHPTKETDLYFSLDNPLIFKYGKSHISGHPLTIIFYYPFVVVGNLLTYIFGIKAKTILFAVLSSVMISLSCLYIYRYIKEIVELSNKETILLTAFFALFSTNLILCFTPETFTLSAFFLSFSAYYYAAYIKNKTRVSVFSSTLLASICLGGVTITNFVKGIIPLFYLKENKLSITKKILVAGFTFFAILLTTEITLQISSGRSFYGLLFEHQQVFTSRQYDSILDYLAQVYSNFWGAPIFFSEIINNTYYSFNSQQTISMVNQGGTSFGGSICT